MNGFCPSPTQPSHCGPAGTGWGVPGHLPPLGHHGGMWAAVGGFCGLRAYGGGRSSLGLVSKGFILSFTFPVVNSGGSFARHNGVDGWRTALPFPWAFWGCSTPLSKAFPPTIFPERKPREVPLGMQNNKSLNGIWSLNVCWGQWAPQHPQALGLDPPIWGLDAGCGLACRNGTV